MFSPNSSSPFSNLTSHERSHKKSFTLPHTPAKLALPTGECQFILLHPSVPGQRCSCQGFRRNESRLGSSCECGHQACYHAIGNVVSSSRVKEPVSPPAQLAQLAQPTQMVLLERIHRLEEQYRHDRKIWEEELTEERQARREDARVLREAMHSFYKFMEREVPQKFTAVDDKTDSLLDHVSRLEERIGILDDSTMALEIRVSDLEGDDGNGENDVHEKDQDDGIESEGMDDDEKPVGEDERNPKRTRQKWQTAHEIGTEQRSNSPPLNDGSHPTDAWSYHTTIAHPGRPIALQSHSTTSITKSPTVVTHSYPTTACSIPLEFAIEAHAPNIGAHTYVRRLTFPPRDFVSRLLSKPENPPYATIFATNIRTVGVPLVRPPRPRSASGIQNIDRNDSVRQNQVSRAYPSPQEESISPYCELPNPPSRKRKLDVGDGRASPETWQRSMFIRVPPPLSLSGPDLEV
ncbi:hypothetical protein ACJ72_07674 [Emergomyces africanus]|uniref:Uncharacterized protein n=1 Tax=Emergomyces africanus TaxID=1955775 RepID=A0A1B7NN42_9EURO|nr:hypothetical protein ACJ72_07674 [Emergomyces africanus]